MKRINLILLVRFCTDLCNLLTDTVRTGPKCGECQVELAAHHTATGVWVNTDWHSHKGSDYIFNQVFQSVVARIEVSKR